MILRNVARFLPFSRIELDMQDDKIIENENESYQTAGLKNDVELMLDFGYSEEEIICSYPNNEESVRKILRDLGRLI